MLSVMSSATICINGISKIPSRQKIAYMMQIFPFHFMLPLAFLKYNSAVEETENLLKQIDGTKKPFRLAVL